MTGVGGCATPSPARPILTPVHRACARAAVSRAQPAFDYGACIADLADAAGHINPNVTRAVYRHQISDTVTRAPAALDQALAAEGEQA